MNFFVEYIVFPFIALIMALRAINQVHAVFKSVYVAPIVGLVVFLLCFWMFGNLWYGVLLAVGLSLMAVSNGE